jgi:crotonobetainyl-CoA:carnitine CoA-transferase CaiB-like acyl-CoA transferase
LNDLRFSSREGRKANERELDRLITEWTANREAESVVRLLQDAGITAGVVQNAGDLAGDEQLMERKFFVSLDHPVLGRTMSDRSPLLLDGCQRVVWKAAPLLGEDNEAVFLGLLGLSDAEFRDYSEKGIIG